MIDKGSVTGQDLFHAEGDRRDLVLGGHMFGGADYHAEGSRSRLAKVKERMLIILQLWKSLDRLMCQRDQSLDDLKSGPKDFSCDDSTRNLNLEARYRLIALGGNYSVQLVSGKLLLQISNRRVGRVRPEVG
jgi:hypothetical protein